MRSGEASLAPVFQPLVTLHETLARSNSDGPIDVRFKLGRGVRELGRSEGVERCVKERTALPKRDDFVIPEDAFHSASVPGCTKVDEQGVLRGLIFRKQH